MNTSVRYDKYICFFYTVSQKEYGKWGTRDLVLSCNQLFRTLTGSYPYLYR